MLANATPGRPAKSESKTAAQGAAINPTNGESRKPKDRTEVLDLVSKVRFPDSAGRTCLEVRFSDFGGRTCLGLAGKVMSAVPWHGCCNISPFGAVDDGTVVPLPTAAFAAVGALVISALNGPLPPESTEIELQHHHELGRSLLARALRI